MQSHKRFAAFPVFHFHVMPAELRPDARAERLGNRLLRRKPRRDEWRGYFVRPAIGDFLRQQDALKETVAKALDLRRHARHFDDVNAEA